MMNKRAYTPKAWVASGREIKGNPGSDNHIATCYGYDAETNANLIVRAVNCHDDLLKGLEGIVKLYDYAYQGHEHCECAPCVMADKARAAIAKAEVKP